MASSLELGPGIRLLGPSRSRNFSRESHLRRRTSSSSIIAMCAAGPPNAVNPKRKKKRASSPSAPFRREPGTSSPTCPESATRCGFSMRPPSVERKAPGARQQQENEAHEHRIVGAPRILHAPETGFEENWKLRGYDRRGNHAQQRRRRKPRPQP